MHHSIKFLIVYLLTVIIPGLQRDRRERSTDRNLKRSQEDVECLSRSGIERTIRTDQRIRAGDSVNGKSYRGTTISCVKLVQAEGRPRKLLVPVENITRACPFAIIG